MYSVILAGFLPISTSSTSATARALLASVLSRSVASVGPSVCDLPLAVSVTSGCNAVPVFGNFSVLIHPDDVERHQLIGPERSGIAPDVVHEDIVAVFEHADVLGGGSGLCQHGQQLYEGVKPGRNEGVVLDVIRIRHLAEGIGVPLQGSAEKLADNRLVGGCVIGKSTGGKQGGSGSNCKGSFHFGGPFKVEVKSWWKVWAWPFDRSDDGSALFRQRDVSRAREGEQANAGNIAVATVGMHDAAFDQGIVA